MKERHNPVERWVGLDLGKERHHATVIDPEEVSPAVERVLGPRLEHPAARAVLARYPSPTAMREAGRRRLGAAARSHAPRMWRRLVDDLVAALAAQSVRVPAEAAAGRVIAELAGELGRDALALVPSRHQIRPTRAPGRPCSSSGATAWPDGWGRPHP